VRDIRDLLLNAGAAPGQEDRTDIDVGAGDVRLWDDSGVELPAGHNYGGEYDTE
jgi:hypothetical protein